MSKYFPSEYFAIVLIGFCTFIVSALLTGYEIPILKRLHTGQNIREEGPEAHLAKAGTPSMGGISILLSFVIMSAAIAIVNPEIWMPIVIVIIPTLGYGLIGFYDDYLKIVKHENEGLTAKQKLLIQIVIGLVFSVARYYWRDAVIYIPFTNISLNLGKWIIPFTLFVFVAMTNAVNLTDGLDGLASSVTMNASFFISLIAFIGISTTVVNLKDTTSIFKSEVAAVLGIILAGACGGFLVFNHNPAKLFMGDTGSLALGACISAIAMIAGLDLLLPLVGIIYVVEALSVIIQVVVFKTQNGRRFFRMAPIHHHFELGGWSEVFIDTVFCVITVAMGIICLIFMV